MGKINWNSVFTLIKRLRKNPKDISNLMEISILANSTEEEKQDYFKIKKTFTEIKDELKKVSKKKLISEKIVYLIKKGKDRKKTKEEEFLSRGYAVFMEREVMILPKLLWLNRKFSKRPLKSFEVYILTNFYRSLCEISLNLIREPFMRKLEVIEKNSPEKKNKCKSFKKLIKQERLTLGFVNKLCKFAFPKSKLGGLFKKTFDYDRKKGFYLRNLVAHEKLLFQEIDIKSIIIGLGKINRFNIALMQPFYLDPLGPYLTKAVLNPAESLYSPLLPKRYSLLLKFIK